MINPETCEDGQDNEKQDEMEEGMQETTNPEICEDDLDDEQQEEMAEGAEDAQQTTNPQESEKDQNQEQRARMEESVDTLKWFNLIYLQYVSLLELEIWTFCQFISGHFDWYTKVAHWLNGKKNNKNHHC